MDLFQEAQKLIGATKDLAQTGTNYFNESVEEAKNTAAHLSANVEDFKHHSGQLVQQGFEVLSGSLETVKNSAFEIGVTGGAIADALKDLPQTAEELAREMPKIAYRLQNRAGLRVGDAPRSDTDVMKLFEKIPGTSKLGSHETRIREFLADKHGSHIISRQQGVPTVQTTSSGKSELTISGEEPG